MAMSRIIRTLAPKRSAILTCSRRFSAGSVDQGESIKTYSVGVLLPKEKRSSSQEERDDWFHWFLSSTCDGSKAATPIKSPSSYRDPKIIKTRPNSFCARLSIQDVEALLKRDEFIYAEPVGKVDWNVCAFLPKGDEAFEEEADEQQYNDTMMVTNLRDADMGHENESNRRTYKVGVELPEEKWSDSDEEQDDWYHWFLSSSCGGSKAAAAAAAAPIKNYRDPRILSTYLCGFVARLSVREIASFWDRDEFMYVVPAGKFDTI